jgi:molybdenum cofactor cytidylyltransferase
MLAAGSASRMGSIKQLLPYRGRTLIEHAIAHASEAGFSPIVVVLGAKAEEIEPVVQRTPCQIVINPNWASGMGSSLKAGVVKLLELLPDAPGLATLLADQPRISARQLISMVKIFEEGKCPIVASEYDGSIGVPAIFGHEFFPNLLSLPAEAGARHLLRDAGPFVHRYSLPEAAIDVDTPHDYAELR